MKIIMVRHGEAERQTTKDSERQLTELGKRQAEETAAYILNKYQPDTLVVSPYDRAQQTLDAFSTHLPNVPVQVVSNITPSDDAVSALNTLMKIKGECVVIVCHMPIVAKLTALLTAAQPEPFNLAEARILEAEFIGADMADLVDRFVPQQ